MKAALITHGYCAPIIQYAVIAQTEQLHIEANGNFQKQSYRTRMKIATSTGTLTLIIPILHRKDKTERQRYYDVKIENKFHWQRDHWRSLKIAYQTSPYFEYYEDEFEPLYHTEYETLIDFNKACHAIIMECLQLDITPILTKEYFKNPEQIDCRQLVNAKKEPQYPLPQYHQLFNENHGYLENLTILDLLFNLGPSAQDYLEKIDLTGLSA
ncbi:WbqC-like protein family [Dokdonia sp. MED134]|uniref:WbqC family protein n=1 Tax=Dokdonia sp. MED134 TaxID=313590 RepID=UPI000068E4F7|nr:WbqC family protein [Dokdonia sp. MED134]EAQ38714.1 WbqC-like protein family [Dokdonia sp. MED134]